MNIILFSGYPLVDLIIRSVENSRHRIVKLIIESEMLHRYDEVCAARNIQIESYDTFLNYNIDQGGMQWEIGLVAGYSKIFRRKDIDRFQKGMINVHPSLLPKYRGPEPLPWQLLKQEKKSGITIHQITDQIDTGPILAQSEYILTEEESFQTLFLKFGKRLKKVLGDCLTAIEEGTVSAKMQDEQQASYYPILTQSDRILHWHGMNGNDVVRFVRSFPGTKPAIFEMGNSNYGIKDAQIIDNGRIANTGVITKLDNTISLATKDSRVQLWLSGLR